MARFFLAFGPKEKSTRLDADKKLYGFCVWNLWNDQTSLSFSPDGFPQISTFVFDTNASRSLARAFSDSVMVLFRPSKTPFWLKCVGFFYVDYCWAVSKLGTYIFNRKIFMGCKRRPNKVCQIKGVNSLFQRFIGALFGRQMYTLLSGLYLFVSVCIFNPHVIPILISGKIFDEMAWFFSLSLSPTRIVLATVSTKVCLTMIIPSIYM